MASGILGGGALQSFVQAAGYTTPSGKTTTTSLLLTSGAAGATNVSISLGQASIALVVPASGIVTLAGIVLAAGQGVYITAYASGINYLLTGWESTV